MSIPDIAIGSRNKKTAEPARVPAPTVGLISSLLHAGPKVKLTRGGFLEGGGEDRVGPRLVAVVDHLRVQADDGAVVVVGHLLAFPVLQPQVGVEVLAVQLD